MVKEMALEIRNKCHFWVDLDPDRQVRVPCYNMDKCVLTVHISRVIDPHNFGKPDLRQILKLDPDAHQSEEPDPH